MRYDSTAGSSPAMLAFGAAVILAGAPLHAATVIQPDIRVGVTHLDNAGFTGGQDFNATGGEVQAQLKIGFVDQRGAITLTPMVRISEYSEERVSDREEQRLQFNWFRDFETAATNTLIDFQRQDLFSSEFRDPLLDPDDIPDFDDSGSGFVDVESTRTRSHFRQDFIKEIGERSGLVFGLDYVDVRYDDSDVTARVDYDEVQFDTAWRRALSERTGIVLQFGAERYNGDNGATADSLSGELGFDVDVSETARLSVLAGYERVERSDEVQDLDPNNEFIFTIYGQKSTELTRFRAIVARNVRPTSIGNVTNQTGGSFYVDRKLSPRWTISGGIHAFRQDRGDNSNIDDDRDYVSGKIELQWRLSRQWFLEASISHTRQDFDAPLILNGTTSEDRSRLLLNLRYVGLNEVPVLNDPRFLRRGY